MPDLGFPEQERRREQRGPPSHQMSSICRSRRGEEGRAALGASRFRSLSPASEGCNYKFLGARDREASSPDEVRTIVVTLVRPLDRRVLQQKLDLLKLIYSLQPPCKVIIISNLQRQKRELTGS